MLLFPHSNLNEGISLVGELGWELGVDVSEGLQQLSQRVEVLLTFAGIQESLPHLRVTFYL